jgi:hypothetical protein
MSDLSIQSGEQAFFSPCHQRDMWFVSLGEEPMTGETYGEWECPTCGALWLESESADEWERVGDGR